MSTFDLHGIGMTSQRTRGRLVQRLREQGISDESVLATIGETPRHIFIEEALAHRAYEDTALPIGHGQTISQPYIVALMTQTLLNEARQCVLEIGTGSGYQTAVLAALVERVISVERIRPLQQRAQERLRAMGLRNARLKYSDGMLGWPDDGPYDGILVTAAPPVLPPALLDQLAVGGRLVAPVGGGSVQELQIYDRDATGVEARTVEYVRFVPLLKGLQRS